MGYADCILGVMFAPDSMVSQTREISERTGSNWTSGPIRTERRFGRVVRIYLVHFASAGIFCTMGVR